MSFVNILTKKVPAEIVYGLLGGDDQNQYASSFGCVICCIVSCVMCVFLHFVIETDCSEKLKDREKEDEQGRKGVLRGGLGIFKDAEVNCEITECPENKALIDGKKCIVYGKILHFFFLIIIYIV